MADEPALRPLRYRDAKPRQRARFRAIVVVLTVVVLVVLAVVADITARAIAEDAVSTGIEQQLPDTVDGEISTQIGGFSMLAQLIAGRFDEVHLRSDALTVTGIPLKADVTLSGVPLDQSKTIDSADGTVAFTDATASRVLADNDIDGTLEFGENTMTFASSVDLLGIAIDLTAVATPALENGAVVFSDEKVSVGGGGASFDATGLLDVLAPGGLSFCVAQYLPSIVELNGVEVAPGTAVVDFSAKDVSLSSDPLASLGSCS